MKPTLKFTFYYSHEIASEFPAVTFKSKSDFMKWAYNMEYAGCDNWTYGNGSYINSRFMEGMPEKIINGIPCQCRAEITRL